MKARPPNALACMLRDFLGDHLPRLRGLSPHTILSYRDSLVLLLRFLASRKRGGVIALDLDDIGPDDVIAFLRHLEEDRGNAASTRNIRLAAIHAFFRFVASSHPERLEQCQRILGVPFKRFRTRPVEYLEYDEILAVLTTIDRSTKQGRRDYALLVTMFNTGGRVQEILDLRAQDLQLVRPHQLRLMGKGRKERICPLWAETAQLLKEFCAERQLDLRSSAPLFVNRQGEPLTRFGVRYILRKYFDRARQRLPSLSRKRLHPHSMRHSTAVHMLKAGVDLSTISQWLGHASINTTNRYATIDLDMKREAIARARPVDVPRRPTRWRRDESILAWLEAL